MSLYILTLEEMKRELGITDGKDDAGLTLWMEGLQARFDDYCERNFLRVEEEEEIHDGGVTSLFLKRFPVENITSIHIDVDQDWDDIESLESDDYLLNAARGAVIYGRGSWPWPVGLQNIRVVYTGGFVAAGQTVGDGQTAMPDTVRRAFLLECGFEWRNRLQLGRESISGMGATVSIAPAQFLPEVLAALNSYRRRIV